MRRSSFVLAAVLALLPGAVQAQQMSAARRTALSDTLRAEAEKFAEGLRKQDADLIMSLFTPKADMTYFDNTNLLSRDRLRAVATNFFNTAEHISGKYQPATVVVLGPDSGVFYGVFQADATSKMKDGTPVWNTDGKPGSQLWTFVYRRGESGKFEIVHAHQTRLAPGRVDQYNK